MKVSKDIILTKIDVMGYENIGFSMAKDPAVAGYVVFVFYFLTRKFDDFAEQIVAILGKVLPHFGWLSSTDQPIKGFLHGDITFQS